MSKASPCESCRFRPLGKEWEYTALSYFSVCEKGVPLKQFVGDLDEGVYYLMGSHSTAITECGYFEAGDDGKEKTP